MRRPISVALERPTAQELSDLLRAVGWGEHSISTLDASIRAYSATVCARSERGELVGYASAFSDGAITTMLGEVVVHPAHQRRGVGRAIMRCIEHAYPSAPTYVKALGESRAFFEKLGFRCPATPVTTMFKRPRSAHDEDAPLPPDER